MLFKNKQRIAIMQMTLCATLWSIAGIFIKLIDWNPFAIAGVRSLFAALAVAAYMLAAKQKIIVSKAVLINMVFLVGTFLSFVSANKLTTAANAIVLQYTSPVFIVILSALFLRQRFRLSDIITVTVALGGISIFFIESLDQGQLLGNMLGILAGVFMACMFIAVGKTDKEEKMSGILFGHLLTALIGVPFLFFSNNTISKVSVSSIIILGILQLGVPYILFGLASEHCPPLACCLIAAVEPLLNPVWVLIFDGERPGVCSVIGGIIVISAVTVQCILQDKYAALRAEQDISSASGQQQPNGNTKGIRL